MVLVSAAEYGLKDSTYVYSVQKYDAGDDLTYIGEFNYVVKARPADAVIDLGTYNMACSDTNTKISIYPINAVYAFHKQYYSRYPVETFGADFVNKAVIDLTLFSLDGEIVNVAAFFGFGYASKGETSYLSLPMKKPGKWEVSATTHFANVRYTFVVTVNVI